jgi:hypothetical protein
VIARVWCNAGTCKPVSWRRVRRDQPLGGDGFDDGLWRIRTREGAAAQPGFRQQRVVLGEGAFAAPTTASMVRSISVAVLGASCSGITISMIEK